MSHSPPAEDVKPRACSVHSVSTVTGDDQGRSKRKGSRAKHSWEYVPVDPAEDEVPPPTATRLEKELYSSFTNNFLSGQGRRTRAAAINASQNFHEHSGSESSPSHPASENGFSTTTTTTTTTTTNSAASPASSPTPPSAPNAIRKRKDSAAPTSDSHRKKPKTSTPAPPATSDPPSATVASATTSAIPAPASSSPPPHQAPAVQRAQSVQQDRSAASAVTSRATTDGSQAKDSGKRKSSVFDDATNKTKTNKRSDSKPSPAPDPFENHRKRKTSPAADKMGPKVKKPRTTSTATTDAATKSAKAAAMQKRDSLLQEDVYAQGLPWSHDVPHHNSQQQSNGRQHQQNSSHHNKIHHHYKQQRASIAYPYSPTRAQLAEQLEEITHRGIAGGPANFSSLREYRAACAAEAAWQERDQEVVERMLDNPRVIEVLKRLRQLSAEIEAERTSGKGMGKGHGKGGRKRKVSHDLMDGD
ncbi:hypothetical protein GTA08_BOTSDO01848 [Botryosphaeria dothidea]|uniref:Uncharacterized protein n=1 Tax=Botryosphaeria dothidea TaxID=55169 RepID=A0A8H4J208_9PEZI|nr:hypothetical protein GTA08_BOTSDO01848 [Botryosphaeria dothidea]